LEFVFGALLGGKILSVKNSVNRPGLGGNTLAHGLGNMSSFKSAGVFVGAGVEGKWQGIYLLA
jgi:hypothetical protein